MRIIAGTHRHRIIEGPPENARNPTRPITDRVKQALFDRLWSQGALESPAAVDVFAGTGSLGLEALSRGVEHVTFIERDRRVRSILDANLDTLQLADRAAVIGGDALSGAWVGLLPHKPVGLVFLDPPYAMTSGVPEDGDEAEALPRVTALIEAVAAVTTPDALLVLRTDGHAKPPAAAGWDEPVTHPYGSMAVHFYRRRDRATERPSNEGG